jgi:hypothetical protein
VILDGLVRLAVDMVRSSVDALPVVSIHSQSFAGISGLWGILTAYDTWLPMSAVGACIVVAFIYLGVSVPFLVVMWVWRSVPIFGRG